MAGLRVRVKNPDLNREETTHVGTDYAVSAGTALVVASNDDIAANDYLVIGNPGEEMTELGRVSSVSGATAVTLSAALKFAHGANTPIFKSLYNQISLERKPTAGAYAEITEGKIEIDFDAKDGFTIISVAAGLSTDTYKWRFYNVASGGFSGYSGELAGTGLTRASVGYLIAQFRRMSGIPDHESVPDEQIIQWFNDCHDMVESEYDRWWFLLTETTDVTVVDGYKFGLDTDFARMEAVLFDDGTTNYRLKYVTLPEFDQLRINDATMSSSDSPRWWTLLPPDATYPKGYIGIHTPALTAALVLTKRFYKEMAALETFDDTTSVPTPMILVNYALMKYYLSKEQFNTANIYKREYNDDMQQLKKTQRRQVGEVRSIKEWRGHGGYDNLYGTQAGDYSDTIRENDSNW